uniref:Uncharacterized protein n=1 Tax=Parascaris univalens TaxID=6257 RepID=A0A914ZN70_PARUN
PHAIAFSEAFSHLSLSPSPPSRFVSTSLLIYTLDKMPVAALWTQNRLSYTALLSANDLHLRRHGVFKMKATGRSTYAFSFLLIPLIGITISGILSSVLIVSLQMTEDEEYCKETGQISVY